MNDSAAPAVRYLLHRAVSSMRIHPSVEQTLRPSVRQSVSQSVRGLLGRSDSRTDKPYVSLFRTLSERACLPESVLLYLSARSFVVVTVKTSTFPEEIDDQRAERAAKRPRRASDDARIHNVFS